MKSSLAILLCSAGVALAGCTTSADHAAVHEPYVKPGLIMLTADQAQRRGLPIAAPEKNPTTAPELSPLDASAVVAPAGVKVYALNRAADPFDPDVMHEAHVVYRRETAPPWRLDAPAGQKIMVGPQITDGRQDLQPLLTKELSTVLADQRRATEANRDAIKALFQAVDALTRQQQVILQRLQTTRGLPPPTRESTPAAEPSGTPEADGS